jgi:tetratricopeptide (TPR) repeat protein
MKKFTIALVLHFLMITFLQAQSSQVDPAERAFQEAYELCDANPEKALVAFQQFLIDFPKAKPTPAAHYDIGYLQHKLLRNEEAIVTFKQILEMPYNDKDPNNLMEPYKLYKHNSCRQLAEIYLERKDYKLALHFINLFDKKYPYQHFCGNEWAAYDNYKATMLAMVYDGEGHYESAVDTLLPYIINNGLASNENVIATLERILDNHYSKDELRNEFQKGLKNIRVSAGKNKKATTVLFGKEFKIPEVYGEGELNSEEDFRQLLSKNEVFVNYSK